MVKFKTNAQQAFGKIANFVVNTRLRFARNFIYGIKNLFEIYLSIVDEVMIFDNSVGKPELIAEKTLESEVSVLNEIKFDKLKKYYNENS